MYLSMVLAGAGLLALLGATGAVLQPPSSDVQLVFLNLGLVFLALGHALRSRATPRSVAVVIPARTTAWKASGLAALAGGCLVAAFFAPCWRDADGEPLPAVRLDKVFAGPPPTPQPGPIQEIFFGGNALDVAADQESVRVGEGSLAGRKGTVAGFFEESPLAVRVNNTQFTWPVPPARLHVRSSLPRDRLKQWPTVTIVDGQDARALPLDLTVEKTAPTYVATDGMPLPTRKAGCDNLRPAAAGVATDGMLLPSWQEFSIFLLHARDHQVLPVTVLSSLSSKGGATQGFALPPGLFGITYPIAFTRNAVGLESGLPPLTDYAAVGFTSEGAPLLFPLGKDIEPFDVLAESTLRNLPRDVLESYALRWRRTAYASPDQVILPVRGELGDAHRSPGQCLWATDVPRGPLSWQPLALVALICVVWLTR
jgi:hypothetical protein